jgi:hypothetical protein
MHRTVIAFAAASIALAAPVLAQSSYAAAGAQFEARFDRALDSKALHDGDHFTLTEDATSYRSGPPALKRAKIEGHVEHVSPPRKDHRATLNVILDDIVLADGTTAPIDATITQIGERDPRSHKLRESGAVLGGNVAGHRNTKKRGMAEGAAIAPGAGVALTPRDPKKPVEVKRGTVVRLKLLEPITTVG